MRSRNGSQITLLRYRSLIFFLLISSGLFADEYYISYRYVVQNMKMLNESLFISKAMKKCNGHTIHHSLILEAKSIKDLYLILSNNKEKFINFVTKIGIDVSSHASFHSIQSKTKTVIEMPTQCFKVDFNDNSVKIAPLK